MKIILKQRFIFICFCQHGLYRFVMGLWWNTVRIKSYEYWWSSLLGLEFVLGKHSTICISFKIQLSIRQWKSMTDCTPGFDMHQSKWINLAFEQIHSSSNSPSHNPYLIRVLDMCQNWYYEVVLSSTRCFNLADLIWCFECFDNSCCSHWNILNNQLTIDYISYVCNITKNGNNCCRMPNRLN